MTRPSTPPAAPAESFDRSAHVYDGHVAVNRAGASRLVASVPVDRYPRLLDVGCGTGFASLEAIPRLGVESVVGIDASPAMLAVFRERLRSFPGVVADLRARDVLDMGVEDSSADLVLCSMALHWFTARADAIGRMARALASGGILGVLAPGPAHDRETVRLIRDNGDPILQRLADSIEDNEIDPDVLTDYLVAAGLEPVDVWTETRRRRVSPGRLRSPHGGGREPSLGRPATRRPESGPGADARPLPRRGRRRRNVPLQLRQDLRDRSTGRVTSRREPARSPRTRPRPGR